eukprot:jgi/Botrbrau1/20825/Bobra.0156s0050.3
MDRDRDEAVEFLNQAKLSTETSEKASALKSVWEVVINKQPALIEEFVPEVALLQVDTNKAVRTFVPEFLEAASLRVLNVAVLQVSLEACLGLLEDQTPAVVKRAILASNTIYRCGFWLLASQTANGPDSGRLELLWQTMSNLKDRTCTLGRENDNDGVRLNAIKFMEQVVLLYTGSSMACPSNPAMSVPLSPSHQILKPTVLARDAQDVLTRLIGLLKPPELERLSNSATLVAIKALTAIALQRNQHMGRILPTLLGLTLTGGDQGSAKQASLKAELKKALMAILGSKASAAQAWTSKIEAALKQMGVVASAIRKAERKSKRERQTEGSEDTEGMDRKKAKGSGLSGFSAAQIAQPGLGIVPVPGQASAPAAMQEVVTAVFQLGDLVRRADWDGLHKLVESLENSILVEVVMANMAYLPRQEDVVAADAGLVRPPAEGVPSEDPATAMDFDPATFNNSAYGEPDVKADPQAFKEESAVPLVMPRWTLEAIELKQADMLQLRKSAFVRILKERSRAVMGFKGPVLARVATESLLGDGIGDALLEHILSRLTSGDGVDLALKWLYALYSSEVHSTELKKAGPKSCVKTEGTALEGVEVEEQTIGKEEAGADEQLGFDDTTSRYEAVLMALLEGMREQLPPSNKSLASILLESPALPTTAVFSFLHELCEEGEEWQTLALTTARSLIVQRPPIRDVALDFVLGSATSRDSRVREKAVRLLANKLLGEHGLQEKIEEYARKQLMRIVLVGGGLPPGEAREPSEADVKGQEASNQASPSHEQRPFSSNSEAGRGLEGPLTSTASRQELEEEGLSFVELYTALCTKNHALLPGLFQAFAKARGPYRSAVLKNADRLALVLGPDAPVLLSTVKDTPPGSENLLLKMLYSLTEKVIPSPSLVKACLEAYEQRKDPRLLPPALTGMPKEEVMQFFPFLLLLDPAGFKAALHRLLMPLPPSGSDLILLNIDMLK